MLQEAPVQAQPVAGQAPTLQVLSLAGVYTPQISCVSTSIVLDLFLKSLTYCSRINLFYCAAAIPHSL